MIYLADAKEMKSVDSYSIQTLGIPSMVLMERAAYATAVRINALLKERENKKVIAVCGSGNNGGDGLAIVRILHTMGYDASWYMAGDERRATTETAMQLEILGRMGLSPCGGLEALKGAGLLWMLFLASD